MSSVAWYDLVAPLGFNPPRGLMLIDKVSVYQTACDGLISKPMAGHFTQGRQGLTRNREGAALIILAEKFQHLPSVLSHRGHPATARSGPLHGRPHFPENSLHPACPGFLLTRLAPYLRALASSTQDREDRMATRMGKDHDQELGIEESAGSLRGHTLGRYLNFAPKEHLGWMCAMSKGKGTPGEGVRNDYGVI